MDRPPNHSSWLARPIQRIRSNMRRCVLSRDQILVATIVDQGASKRNIYLPPGSWLDNLNNFTVEGGMWLMNCFVDIDELAYFTKGLSVEH